MKEIFTRSTRNPILRPGESEWRKMYNPGAALDGQGQTHLFPRVQKETKNEDWHSRIGHALSRDGEHFVWREPMLERNSPDEKRGLEDPRITQIGDTYHMVYAAYDGETPRLSQATAKNLGGPWKRQGHMVPEFDFFKSGGKIVRFKNGKPVETTTTRRGAHWSKSGALFAEKIDNQYMLLFGEYYIWLATSPDGVRFDVEQPGLIGPRKGTDFFDNTFVEMGPPPVLTEKGWLVLYHGVNERFQYQIGFLLLDLKNPRNILYRSDEPIFGPREEYELVHEDIDVHASGVTPQVVFCCGAVLRDDVLWVYYGAGDSSICVAWAPLGDILGLAE